MSSDLLSQTVIAMGGTVDHSGLQLVHRGRRLSLSYAPSVKGSPPTLRIDAWAGADPSANAMAFGGAEREGGSAYRDARSPRAIATSDLRPITIRRETSTDRLGKSMRINREIQLGDPAFDDALYIETTVREPIVGAVLHREARAIVVKLLEHPMELTIYGGPYLVSVTWRPIFEESLSRAELEPVFDAIVRLASLLPHDAPTEAQSPHGPLMAVFLPMVVAQLSVVVWLTLSTRAEHVAAAPFLWGALVGLALWVAFVILAALLIRGRSNSLRIVVVCALCLFPVALIVGVSGVPMLNVRLDEGPAVPRELEVTHIRTVRHKNSVSYFAVAPAWSDPSDTLDIRVPPGDRERWERGARVRIVTHRGRFGWLWYDGATLAQPAPPQR